MVSFRASRRLLRETEMFTPSPQTLASGIVKLAFVKTLVYDQPLATSARKLVLFMATTVQLAER